MAGIKLIKKEILQPGSLDKTEEQNTLKVELNGQRR